MVDVVTVEDLVAPIVAASGCALYDVSFKGRTLKISVQRDGGVGLEDLRGITRQLSVLLDDHDPIAGSYTLEVTSPGLERKLTRPDHFSGAIGAEVAVKARDDEGVVHRWRGRLTSADDDGVTVTIDDEDRHFPYGDITGAQTVFDWGPSPKSGGGQKRKKKKK